MNRTWLWAILALIGTLVLTNSWYVADNHKFLLVYWLWVVTIASCYDTETNRNRLCQSMPGSSIFIFLVAALHKSFSPSYMSGEMFETRLLLDERFKAFAHLFEVDKSVTDTALFQYSTLQSPSPKSRIMAFFLPLSVRVCSPS